MWNEELQHQRWWPQQYNVKVNKVKNLIITGKRKKDINIKMDRTAILIITIHSYISQFPMGS